MASVAASSVSMLSCPRLSHQSVAVTRLSNSKLGLLSFHGKGVRMQPLMPRFRICCAAKPETVEKVSSIVRDQLELPADAAIMGESVLTELGADSVDTVEIVIALEEEFGITLDEDKTRNLKTVQDTAELIEKLAEQKGEKTEVKA